MQKLFAKIDERAGKINPFARFVLRLSAGACLGLYLVALVVLVKMDSFGEYLLASACFNGLMDTAPAMLVAGVACAMIADCAIGCRGEQRR